MGSKGAGKGTSEERVDPRGWRLGPQGSRKGPGTAGSGGDWEAGRRFSSSFSSGTRVAAATSTHRLKSHS